MNKIEALNKATEASKPAIGFMVDEPVVSLRDVNMLIERIYQAMGVHSSTVSTKKFYPYMEGSLTEVKRLNKFLPGSYVEGWEDATECALEYLKSELQTNQREKK